MTKQELQAIRGALENGGVHSGQVLRLCDEIERLSGALERIRDKKPKPCLIQAVNDTHNMYKRMAREALEGDQ